MIRGVGLPDSKKDLHNEILVLRASVFDPNTRFPAYVACFEQLKQMAQDQVLGVVFIQLSDMERVEVAFGFERYEQILRRAAVHLQEMNSGEYGGALLLAQKGVYDDQFCVFAPFSLLSRSPLQALDLVARKLYVALEGELRGDHVPGLSLHVGYSLLHYNPFLRFERQVHRSVEEAELLARRREETVAVLDELELRRILARGELATVFQPIVSLPSLEILGYEALTRGPEGTLYEAPDALFACARHSKLSRQLDRACKAGAVGAAAEMPPGALLFINTLTTTLDDPEFLGGRGRELLARSGLLPEGLVWEVSERLPIADYPALVTVLKDHAAAGYGLAIDDVGTGPSSLQLITRARPRFLKIDGSLVSEIEVNLLKQELVASLVALACNIGARLIAEGVQELAQMRALQELGVEWGQGFLFARPSPGFAERITLGESGGITSEEVRKLGS
jgi:EAL domain-containing protein (putative c-di-GMP-specific phosphodiesterase class I)